MSIILAAVLLCVAIAPEAVAQTTKPAASRRYESGPLRPADFSGRLPATRGATKAFTFTSIDYSYRFQSSVVRAGVHVVATELSAHAMVRPDQSWNLTPEDARLMDHEQGHFDITQLHTLRWRRHAQRSIDKAAFTAHGATQAAAEAALQARIQKEFQLFYDAWQAEQRRYDDETNHGTHRARQAEWRQRLDAELKERQRPVSRSLDYAPPRAKRSRPATSERILASATLRGSIQKPQSGCT
jgi:hypothetical protein